jgi:hypothetical protein
MKKRNHTTRTTVYTVIIFFTLVLSLYPVDMEDTLTYVDVWVDRGCGGHYRRGELVHISFRISSPAPWVLVTIAEYQPGEDTKYPVRNTLYGTNIIHSLPRSAECPAGLKILEIFTVIPSQYLSDIDSPSQESVRATDTCHFYVDTPCDGIDSDGDGFYKPHDCDDNNPLIHPGGEEVCDNRDNDCDGQIDEECYTCILDWDGDSFSECNDCNNNDPFVYPGAEELCDGKDNDCDGLIDEECCICYDDKDRDGYSDCWDCNDLDPTVYPGAEEPCDGKDNDCDGIVDEGSWCDYTTIWVDKPRGEPYSEGELVQIYYQVRSAAPSAVVTVTDYPSQGTPITLVSRNTVATNTIYTLYRTATCPVGLETVIISATITVGGKPVTLMDECAFYVTHCRVDDYDEDGYYPPDAGGYDCDDNDAGIHPGTDEVCDGKDNDCDGFIDEGFDCNYAEIWVDRKCGETYNDGESVVISFRISSSAPTARITLTDYPPESVPTVIFTNRTVTTNKVYVVRGIARCSGLQSLIVTATMVIEGRQMTVTDECGFYVVNCRKPDNDSDGYDSPLFGGNDCNDDDSAVFPGAPEVPDGQDNDCDSIVDEMDYDGDGYISPEGGGNDCDDNDRTVYPGAPEIGDGKDNNCNGEIDEGITMDQIDIDRDGYPLTQDCNDKDPGMNPGAAELCSDGKDNDCDGKIDCEDEECEGDSACRKLFDVSIILSLVQENLFLFLGVVAGIVGALVAVILLLRRRRKIPEELETISLSGLETEILTEEKEKEKGVPTEKKKGIFARLKKTKTKPPEEPEGPEIETEVSEGRKKGLFERLGAKGEEEEEDITSILDEDMVRGLK